MEKIRKAKKRFFLIKFSKRLFNTIEKKILSVKNIFHIYMNNVLKFNSIKFKFLLEHSYVNESQLISCRISLYPSGDSILEFHKKQLHALVQGSHKN